MKTTARIIALFSLAATIGPAVWFCFSAGDESALRFVKPLMLVAMALWFVTAALWQGTGQGNDPHHEDAD